MEDCRFCDGGKARMILAWRVTKNMSRKEMQQIITDRKIIKQRRDTRLEMGYLDLNASKKQIKKIRKLYKEAPIILEGRVDSNKSLNPPSPSKIHKGGENVSNNS